MGKHFEIHPGDRFGRLTAVEFSHKDRNWREIWKFRCDCGKEKSILIYSVLSGSTTSCGCYSRDVLRQNLITHGGTHTRLYNIWRNMKARCGNKKNTNWELYGARGIAVCADWLHNFAAFQEWALANGYADDLTLDRMDNDKGYSPDNCRWATIQEQHANRRPYEIAALGGARVNLYELAKKAGVPYSAFRWRVSKWKDLERAMTQPLRACKQREGGDAQAVRRPCAVQGGTADSGTLEAAV